MTDGGKRLQENDATRNAGLDHISAMRAVHGFSFGTYDRSPNQELITSVRRYHDRHVA